MDAVAAALIVSGCIFAGALVGLLLHRLLPERHLTKEATDVVRLGTGMLSVLTSLVLGLLIATAKSAYDATDHAVRTYGAELILLDEMLRDFGPEATASRDTLRDYTRILLAQNWPERGAPRSFGENRNAGVMLEDIRDAVRGLKPGDSGQAWLREQTLQSSTSLMRQRWLLIEQSGPSVQPIVLAILVCWVSLIFVSFGLTAPLNATVLTALLVCSLAIGGAVFLIMEMDTPFGGVLRISSRPIANAVAHMTD